MDDKIIIALAALGGVAVTGLFNLLVKYIDVIQKSNEQRMSLRSVYITRKLDACQSYIGKNNVLINNLLLNINYFEKGKLDNQSIIGKDDLLIQYSDKTKELSLDKTFYISLFFDISSFENDISALITAINTTQDELDSTITGRKIAGFSLTPDEIIKVNDIIRLYRELVAKYRSVNVFLRDKMSGYDII